MVAVSTRRRSQITSRQKAAVLLVTLGPESSAEVFKHLKQEEIEMLTLEIASLRQVTPELRNRVLNEFQQLVAAREYIAHGGIAYAKNLLEKALGEEEATAILDRLTSSLQVRPFEFIRQTDPAQLLNYIQNEHPQTIAMILAYLPSERAAAILSALPPDSQADVARRIAIMDPTAPDIIAEVEGILERKLSSVMVQDFSAAGGVESLVDVLNNVDRSTERSIMDVLEVNDPELAEEVKKRMFVFEDLVMLDNRSVQRVLREVDFNEDLPLALKVASDVVKEKITQNISKRAAASLMENMEYMGPVRLRAVEEAQQRIVALVRRLEEDGEIVVMRGQGDELVV